MVLIQRIEVIAPCHYYITTICNDHQSKANSK